MGGLLVSDVLQASSLQEVCTCLLRHAHTAIFGCTSRPSINQPGQVAESSSRAIPFSRRYRVLFGLTMVGRGERESEGVREKEAIISISNLQGVHQRLFVNGSTWIFHLSPCV
jgi:hypothetical protein